MSTTVETVLAARNVSVPIIAVQTSDQIALRKEISDAIGDDVVIDGKKRPVPKIVWDRVNGLVGINASGKEAVAKHAGGDSAYPEVALKGAQYFPDATVLFFMNAHRFIGESEVSTGILNLRNPYKMTMRTLIPLGPMIKLPAELRHDVVVIDHALPTQEELALVVSKTYNAAQKAVGLPVLQPDMLARATDAVRGLAPFDTEQVISMSLRASGLDLNDVWERKRITINQTDGLTMAHSKVTWDDLGGHARLREFSERVRKGKETPVCLFMLDEVEKMLAASGGEGVGDSSGVSQDQKGVLLRKMEDLGWTGILSVGPPGTGKTAAGQALANALEAEFVKGDFGAMKDSLVGASENQVREVFNVVEGIGGSRVMVFATANQLGSVTPDMRRRFWMGRWYFDLPDGVEKDAIWKIHLTKHGFDPKEMWSLRPNDEEWTGAEIRNCCNLAWRLGITLEEASTYIVPVAKEMPEQVQNLRELAHGKFLSTSYAGTYDKTKIPQIEGATRKIGKLVGVAAIYEQPGEDPKSVTEIAGKKQVN